MTHLLLLPSRAPLPAVVGAPLQPRPDQHHLPAAAAPDAAADGASAGADGKAAAGADAPAPGRQRRRLLLRRCLHGGPADPLHRLPGRLL